MHDALASISRFERVALIDFVRAPSHEARLAFPTLQQQIVERFEGRLAWAGSIDQQLIGRAIEPFDDIVISELPSVDACRRALALRQEWQPELIVSGHATLVGRPWSRFDAVVAQLRFAALGLLGGGPTPFAEGGTPERFACDGPRHLEPDRAALEQLLAAERGGRVVMLDFLRFSTPSAGQPWDAPPGRVVYRGYASRTAWLVGRMGGRIRYRARVLRTIGSPPELPWQELIATEYPSRAAFLGMLVDPRYRQRLLNRQVGLDTTRTLVCTPHARFY